FHNAPSCVTDSVLDTAEFHIPDVPFGMNAQFFHSFDFENGRDGAVLEISINGGRFTDIREAGGYANYNGTISTQFQSPIAGRAAWTGNSGGYVTAFVGIPLSTRNQNVVLRFRLATDCSGGGGGWSIDEPWV